MATKFIEMFGGIGGFRLGLEACGMTAVGYYEIDKYAVKTYNANFGGNEVPTDVTKVNWNEQPDFDLLTGGFPCQPFSVAGVHRGFSDTRGTLFFEIARAIAAKQPKMLLLENVRGLHTHDEGATYGTILRTLDELGYDVEWQVLNSKNFGVPQNRERVFVVGHLRGSGGRKVFPLSRDDCQDNGGVSSTIVSLDDAGGFISPCLTARFNGYANPTDLNKMKGLVIKVPEVKKLIDGPQAMRVYDPDGLAVTQGALGGGCGAKTGLYMVKKPVACAVSTPGLATKNQNGRRIKDDGEDMFTVTAMHPHGIYDGYRIRRLTPRECARLQGFADTYKIVCSDAQAYKQFGNAVTVNVIKALGTEIAKVI